MERKQFTKDELLYLTGSEEFQRLYASDPVLDQLEAEQIDEHLEYLLVMDALHQIFQVGSASVQSITPAVWCLLWTLGNRFAHQTDKHALPPDETDCDVFLWMLANAGTGKYAPQTIAGEASGFCKRIGLSFDQALSEITDLIRMAFAPLSLLPKDHERTEIRYDADWMIRTGAVAAQESGEALFKVMREMPLSVCFALYINAARKCDFKHEIRRRPGKEICEDMVRRTDELCEEFLRRKRNSENPDIPEFRKEMGPKDKESQCDGPEHR